MHTMPGRPPAYMDRTEAHNGAPKRLTQKCQEALHDAQALAVRHGHQEVDVEHLLSALADQP